MEIPKYFTEGLDGLLKQLYDLIPEKDRLEKYGTLISKISSNRDIEIVQRLYNLVYFLKTDILSEIKNSNHKPLLLASLGMVLITSPKIAEQYNALFDQNGNFVNITGRLSYYASGIFTHTINHLFEQAVKNCKGKTAAPKSMEHLFNDEKMVSDSVEGMTRVLKQNSPLHIYIAFGMI